MGSHSQALWSFKNHSHLLLLALQWKLDCCNFRLCQSPNIFLFFCIYPFLRINVCPFLIFLRLLTYWFQFYVNQKIRNHFHKQNLGLGLRHSPESSFLQMPVMGDSRSWITFLDLRDSCVRPRLSFRFLAFGEVSLVFRRFEE